MFIAFDRSVPVALTVVTLGTSARLRDCLAALVGHDSEHAFTVTCVVNSLGHGPADLDGSFPDGVLVERAAGNLGWAGGLQRGRSLTDAELLVWVQDDMLPEPGWLDALVAAAAAHPEAGAFGSVRVDRDGRVLLTNAGAAEPPDDVSGWSATDRTDLDLPAGVTAYDWVTSKGLLTRAGVFDEVGGPDPRLFPLYHVDKEYSTHLRCHGWDVVLVPGARLWHGQSRSSSTELRAFVGAWRDEQLSARWAAAVTALSGRSSGRVAHPCADWRAVRLDAVERAVGLEAARMLVPFMRERERAANELHEEAALAHAAAQSAVADATAAYQAAQAALADATAAYEAERAERERLLALLAQRDAG